MTAATPATRNLFGAREAGWEPVAADWRGVLRPASFLLKAEDPELAEPDLNGGAGSAAFIL
ncbi:MAG: hypothetical protein K2W84_05510 [Burkholderiales bacterium]|nr:hypothetical protein [Burkholderiales bacterium]